MQRWHTVASTGYARRDDGSKYTGRYYGHGNRYARSPGLGFARSPGIGYARHVHGTRVGSAERDRGHAEHSPQHAGTSGFAAGWRDSLHAHDW